MKRHVGKIINTDQRCVVVLMQIPGREDHALIVPTDNLPMRYEQAIMDLLESAEGQAEENFYAVLNRRLMPDTGKKILVTLHENGLLTALPVANIVMMPMPNMPFPLVKLLKEMGRVVPNQPTTPIAAETQKFNQHQVNQQAGLTEQGTGIAQNLLIEANMLEVEARRKREQAYSFNPSLRPAPEPETAVETMPVAEISMEEIIQAANTDPLESVIATGSGL